MSKKSELVQQLKGARERAFIPGLNKEGKVSKWAVIKGTVTGFKKSKKPSQIGVKHLLVVAGGVLALTLIFKPSKKSKEVSGGCSCGKKSKAGKGTLGQALAIWKLVAPALTTLFGYFRPQLEKALADFLAKQASKKAAQQTQEVDE